MRIILRTDASLKIGSGHAMRCLTLAEELKKGGAKITFISRAHEGNINKLISDKGMKVAELSAPDSRSAPVGNGRSDDYAEWLGVTQEQDARESINAIGKTIPDWLIVDHYGLDKAWETVLRNHVKNIMVIDDLANRIHDCNLLLDQSWFVDKGSRYDGLVSAACTKLLGPEYALLRPEFAEAKKKYKPRNGDVKRIFVFFGGSDPYNLTGMTLRALSDLELAHMEVDAVIGENNPHQAELKKIVAQRPLTNLHIQVKNIATIIAKADLAIASGGVNTWERMCLSIPSIIISFAQNQVIILQDLVKHGLVEHLGDISEINQDIIKQKIIDKINEPSLLSNQINKIKNLINGKGSQIVAEWLIGDLSIKTWEVKCATIDNIELYWVWVNDEQVRKNSINNKPIPFKIHEKWFKNKLDDNKCSLYMICVDKHPVGQVRFEAERNFARIDYSIAKQFRGRKLGKKLLGLAITEFQKHSNQRILGEVLSSNIVSGKTFESLGFNVEIKDGNKIYTTQPRDLEKINA